MLLGFNTVPLMGKDFVTRSPYSFSLTEGDDYSGSYAQSTNQSFTGISFGAEPVEDADTRTIVVLVAYNVNDQPDPLITSGTIGGVTATILQPEDGSTDLFWEQSAVLYANVPTGTSGTVAFTTNLAWDNLNASRIVMDTYSIINGKLKSTTYATDQEANGTTYKNTVAVAVGDFVGSVLSTGLSTSFGGWTGTTSVTSDHVLSSNTQRMQTARFTPTTTDAAHVISAEAGGNGCLLTTIWDAQL